MVTRPFGPHRHAVAEGLGDVVVRRRPARVEHRGGEDGALPGEDDEAAPIGAPGGEAEGGVEIQGRVEELGVVVVGERVVVAAERVHLPGIHPEPLAEELRERQVHERRGGRVVGLGQQGEHVDRHDGSGVLVLGVPVAGEGLDLEEAAGPEPELARVQVQLVVDQAVVRHARVAPSRPHALEDLEQIQVERDAPLGQPVPALPPVAGEPRPRPQVARVGRWRIGLRDCYQRRGNEGREADREEHRTWPPVSVPSSRLLHRGPTALRWNASPSGMLAHKPPSCQCLLRRCGIRRRSRSGRSRAASGYGIGPKFCLDGRGFRAILPGRRRQRHMNDRAAPKGSGRPMRRRVRGVMMIGAVLACLVNGVAVAQDKPADHDGDPPREGARGQEARGGDRARPHRGRGQGLLAGLQRLSERHDHPLRRVPSSSTASRRRTTR